MVEWLETLGYYSTGSPESHQIGTGLCRPTTGNLSLSTQQQRVHFSSQRKIEHLKERDGLHLLSAVLK